MNRVIGRIISISNNNILAEINTNVDAHVMVDGALQFVGEIGSFVIVEHLNKQIICDVISIDDRNELSDKPFIRGTNQRFLRLALIGEIEKSQFKFGVTKLPPIYSEVKLINNQELGVIFNVTDEEERVENNNTKLRELCIGKSVIFKGFNVSINLDNFFGFHFAVFGNTGSGKSNSLARIIQLIFSKRCYSACGAKFVVFDSNGEYKQAFDKINPNNNDIQIKHIGTSQESNEKLEIPVWALSVDDWSVLLHATEKTQIPVIQKALEFIRLFDAKKDDLEKNIVKNHILSTVIQNILSNNDGGASQSNKISTLLGRFGSEELSLTTKISVNRAFDTNFKSADAGDPNHCTIAEAITVNFAKLNAPASLIENCQKYLITDVRVHLDNTNEVQFDLSRFYEALEFAIIYEGSLTSSRIFEYTSSLLTRVRALMESEYCDYFTQTNFHSLEQYVASLVGTNQLVNIDISNMDDSSGEVIIKVLCKLLFDFQKKRKDRNSEPINIIVEEAHRFITAPKSTDSLEYNIFDRIAKEGRKFGLLLGISSQRPNEISRTVVSQCSNFIIHRLQNPEDLTYVSRMVPYIDQAIINRLTYLQRGHALVFGTATKLPMLTSFEIAQPTPNSHNSQITEKWYIENNGKRPN